MNDVNKYWANKLRWIKSVFILLLAINFSTSLATESSKSPKSLFYESMALYKKGKVVEEINGLEKLNKIDPDNPNVISNLVWFLTEAGLPGTKRL